MNIGRKIATKAYTPRDIGLAEVRAKQMARSQLTVGSRRILPTLQPSKVIITTKTGEDSASYLLTWVVTNLIVTKGFGVVGLNAQFSTPTDGTKPVLSVDSFSSHPEYPPMPADEQPRLYVAVNTLINYPRALLVDTPVYLNKYDTYSATLYIDPKRPDIVAQTAPATLSSGIVDASGALSIVFIAYVNEPANSEYTALTNVITVDIAKTYTYNELTSTIPKFSIVGKTATVTVDFTAAAATLNAAKPDSWKADAAVVVTNGEVPTGVITVRATLVNGVRTYYTDTLTWRIEARKIGMVNVFRDGVVLSDTVYHPSAKRIPEYVPLNTVTTVLVNESTSTPAGPSGIDFNVHQAHAVRTTFSRLLPPPTPFFIGQTPFGYDLITAATARQDETMVSSTVDGFFTNGFARPADASQNSTTSYVAEIYTAQKNVVLAEGIKPLSSISTQNVTRVVSATSTTTGIRDPGGQGFAGGTTTSTNSDTGPVTVSAQLAQLDGENKNEVVLGTVFGQVGAVQGDPPPPDPVVDHINMSSIFEITTVVGAKKPVKIHGVEIPYVFSSGVDASVSLLETRLDTSSSSAQQGYETFFGSGSILNGAVLNTSTNTTSTTVSAPSKVLLYEVLGVVQGTDKVIGGNFTTVFFLWAESKKKKAAAVVQVVREFSEIMLAYTDALLGSATLRQDFFIAATDIFPKTEAACTAATQAAAAVTALDPDVVSPEIIATALAKYVTALKKLIAATYTEIYTSHMLDDSMKFLAAKVNATNGGDTVVLFVAPVNKPVDNSATP